MKKVILCGSISAADAILEAKHDLEVLGFGVEIPAGVKDEFLRGRTTVGITEKAEDKIKHDLLRGYYKKIQQSDVVLVVNVEKHGIAGYIGGNTLIEMAFGHVLNKKIYLLHPVPELLYTSEILAMQPIVLNGNIARIGEE